MKTKNDAIYEINTNGDATAKTTFSVLQNDIPSKKTILEQVEVLDNELFARCRVFTWINWPLPLTGQQADWQRELRLLVDEWDKLVTQYLAVQESCTAAQKRCRKLAEKFIKNVSRPYSKRRRMRFNAKKLFDNSKRAFDRKSGSYKKFGWRRNRKIRYLDQCSNHRRCHICFAILTSYTHATLTMICSRF